MIFSAARRRDIGGGRRAHSNARRGRRKARPAEQATIHAMPTLPTSPTGLAATTGMAVPPMSQPDAWRMIRRRAAAAGIAAPIGCHTFRATGITAYLSNGGALEHSQQMAAHESPRTTKLYDRTKKRLTRTDQVVNSRITVKHGARSPARD
jgi:integrase